MCLSKGLFPASSIPILTLDSMAAMDLTPPLKTGAADIQSRKTQLDN